MENSQKWKHLLDWIKRFRLPSDNTHSWFSYCRSKTIQCWCGATKDSYERKVVPTLSQYLFHLRMIILTSPTFTESDHAYVGKCARSGETVTLTCLICGKEIEEVGDDEDEENLEIALERLKEYREDRDNELSEM